MSDLQNEVLEPSTGNVVPLTNKRIVADTPRTEIDQNLLKVLQIEIRRSNEGLTRPGLKEIDLYADDLRSVESESYFGQRFGFALGRRGRVAVINVMDEYDFTSADNKALYMCGSLSWDGETLRFNYVVWLRLLGAAQILFLSLFILFFFAGLALNMDAPWDARLSLLIVIAVLMVCIQWAHRTFIRPFRGLRRRKHVRDEC